MLAHQPDRKVGLEIEELVGLGAGDVAALPRHAEIQRLEGAHVVARTKRGPIALEKRRRPGPIPLYVSGSLPRRVVGHTVEAKRHTAGFVDIPKWRREIVEDC